MVVPLDYVNGLFDGLTAKPVLGKSRMDTATQSLKDLRWLPIHLRVEYKVLVTVSQQSSTRLSLQRPTRIQNTRSSKGLSLRAVPYTKRRHLQTGVAVSQVLDFGINY